MPSIQRPVHNDDDNPRLKSWREFITSVLTMRVRPDGSFVPPSMADASAKNNSIYYSTTASKLVYKDSGGTVNNLY